MLMNTTGHDSGVRGEAIKEQCTRQMPTKQFFVSYFIGLLRKTVKTTFSRFLFYLALQIKICQQALFIHYLLLLQNCFSEKWHVLRSNINTIFRFKFVRSILFTYLFCIKQIFYFVLFYFLDQCNQKKNPWYFFSYLICSALTNLNLKHLRFSQ